MHFSQAVAEMSRQTLIHTLYELLGVLTVCLAPTEICAKI
jgi:hypothetical protein